MHKTKNYYYLKGIPLNFRELDEPGIRIIIISD